MTTESPSKNLAAVNKCADVVATIGARHLGVDPERLHFEGRQHLRWQFGTTPRVLLLGHFDTVWPIGTLETMPWSVDGGVVRGPGVFDMKAGVIQLFHALGTLDDLDGVVVLLNSDEEIGSPTSRSLIEEQARGLDAVLVLEGSGDGGALKTGRKGVSRYRLDVAGHAAHAGLEPDKGVNALVELAHQVLAVSALGDSAARTTVVPAVGSAGTTTNTVPAHASVWCDVRVSTAAEQARVDRDLRALRPTLVGAALTVHGGPDRGPMEPESSTALFALAEVVAARLGLSKLGQCSVGGASDGNLTSALGTPTLDGLGAVGGGAHAIHEHAVEVYLEPRTRLLAALTAEILGGALRRSKSPEQS